MTPEQIQQHMNDIDKLSQMEIARLFRLAPIGHPYFNNKYWRINEHLKKKFNELGGMTPQISKAIDL